MRLLALLASAGVLLLAGAAPADTIGPADDPTFESVARETLGLGDEPILLHGRAGWSFGVDEFQFWRIAKLSPVRGLLILLETRLLFVIWDPTHERYDPLLRIGYDEIADVRQRVWGANQRIVVETKRGTLHAFTYHSSGGVTVNRFAWNWGTYMTAITLLLYDAESGDLLAASLASSVEKIEPDVMIREALAGIFPYAQDAGGD
jgi:hypothetical protein